MSTYDVTTPQGRAAILDLHGRTWNQAPWRVMLNGYTQSGVQAGQVVIVHQAGHEISVEHKQANAAFIAMSHTTLPLALAEIDRLQAIDAARQEGVRAGLRGTSLTDNPHRPSSSPLATAWAEGWKSGHHDVVPAKPASEGEGLAERVAQLEQTLSQVAGMARDMAQTASVAAIAPDPRPASAPSAGSPPGERASQPTSARPAAKSTASPEAASPSASASRPAAVPGTVATVRRR